MLWPPKSTVQLLLIILLAIAPAAMARSEGMHSVFFPVANLGLSYPNGVEATGGVLFGTTKDDSIEGPSVSVRFNGTSNGFGLSAGPGYIAQVSLFGFGGDLWFSRNFQNDSTQSNAVSIEGYIRIILLELRVGLVTNLTKSLSTSPIVGIHLGI